MRRRPSGKSNCGQQGRGSGGGGALVGHEEGGGSGGGIMSSLRLHQVSQQQTDDMYPIFAVISRGLENGGILLTLLSIENYSSKTLKTM